MSYENYKLWLKGLKDSELNAELAKLKRNRDGAPTREAKQAWGRMYDMACNESKRRDDVDVVGPR